MGYLVVGVLFIIGGLSGTMALRGTHSPIALAVVGAGMAIYGIIQLTSGGTGKPSDAARRRTLVKRGKLTGTIRGFPKKK